MNWVHPTSLFLITWVAAFLQATPWCARIGLGAQPDFLPAMVVYAAFNSNLSTTAGVAIVAGLSCDALSSGPFGLSMLPLTVLGALLHRRRDLVLRDSVWSQASLGLVATLAVAVMSLTFLWVFGPLVSTGPVPPLHEADFRAGGDGGPDFGMRLVGQVCVLAIVGAAATPVVFRLFGWIDATFNYRQAPKPVDRADREIKRGRI
ncbi:MAG: rod shape-determining protein MreD [Limisphaerales bacterium]